MRITAKKTVNKKNEKMIKSVNNSFIKAFRHFRYSAAVFLTAAVIAGCSGTGAEKSARKTDELMMWLVQYPRSLNSFVSGDAYSSLISGFVWESLLSTDENTYEEKPYLAGRWTISGDKKTYTFYLNTNAVFSDGVPLTAKDVQFSFEAVYSEKCVYCEPVRSFIGPIQKITVLDAHTIQFTMSNVHFQNLNRLGSMSILPAHIYGKEGTDFNKDFDKILVGSGPYVLIPDPDTRRRVRLTKNTAWWTKGTRLEEEYASYYNFNDITFIVHKDDKVALELFKKKSLDCMVFGQALYAVWDATNSRIWKTPSCERVSYPTGHPHSWSGVALNMRRGTTKDRDFRRALQLLMNRDLYNSKLFSDKTESVGGIFMPGSPYSANRLPDPYDPAEAMRLLESLGYTEVDTDGIRFRMTQSEHGTVKQRASVEIMYSYEGHSMWASIFKEDARKAGLEITLKFVEWTTATKLMDEFNFDGFVIGWSGGAIPAPEQLWEGAKAHIKGSSNYPGFDNDEVNDLIQKGPREFDEEKRTALYRKMERLILEEYPYLLRVKNKNTLIGYWSDQMRPADPPFLKYSGTSSIYTRWLPAAD